VPDLGSHWALCEDGIDVKKYPCCYYTHAAIYAAIELAEEYALEAVDIDEVRVTASQGAADALAHDDPATGLEAKFSMPYLIGRAIADRDVGLAAFDEGNIDEPAVQTVRERVAGRRRRVALRLQRRPRRGDDPRRRDPRTHARAGRRAPHDDPLLIEELHEKFQMCAAYAPASVAVDDALAALDDLRSVSDVSDALESL